MKKYEKYKPSGLPWIGKIPEHWDVNKLKYFIVKNDGGVWGEDNGDTYVLRSTEITIDAKWNFNEEPAKRKLSDHEIEKALLYEGDLLITKSSGSSLHIGKSVVVTSEVADKKCCFSNFMQRIRPKEGFASWYFYYFLNSSLARDQYNYLSTTTTGLSNLGSELISNILVPIPLPEEQTAIATYLDRKTAQIDDLIGKKRRLIELLNEEKQAIINQAVTKGLNPNVKMKDSDIPWIGKIPEHWEVNKLKYFIAKNDGGVWGEDNGDTYVLRSTEITIDAKWNFNEEPAKRNLNEREIEKALLYEGDLLITKSSGSALHIGKTVVVTKKVADMKCCFSNFMQRIRPKQKFSSWFFYYFLNSSLAREQYNYLSTTTTGLSNLGSELISNILISIPLSEEQSAIADFLNRKTSQIDELIEKKQYEIVLLQEYRSALISEAVTGKIDVRGLI